MRISDFSTEANTIDQQIADVKDYAKANYNKFGWDLVIETMSDEDVREVIGKRKNTRAAINAVYAHISPTHQARQEARAAGGVDEEEAAAKRDRESEARIADNYRADADAAEAAAAAVAESSDEDVAKAEKRAKRNAQAKARRAAKAAAK